MITAFCPFCQKVQPMRVEQWRQRYPNGDPPEQSKGKTVTIERITCAVCHRWLKDTLISSPKKIEEER